METFEIVSHITNLETQCTILSERLKAKTENSVDIAKFYAVALSTEEVARFHNVSTARVRDYAHRGLIELHPDSTDAKLFFRASDVLKINFDVLRIKKSIQKR